MSTSVLDWDFPLPRCHTGVPLGNGRLGILLWGDDKLNVTIARSGFWDRRNGKRFGTDTTYREVKRLVDARDEEGLCQLFAKNVAQHPFQLGGGRLEINVPGFRPLAARIQLERGEVEIDLENERGETCSFVVGISMAEEVAWIEGLPAAAEFRLIPSWDFMPETLAKLGLAAPERAAEKGGEWFRQCMPADEALAVGCRWQDGRLIIESALGRASVNFANRTSRFADLPQLRSASQSWWQTYWQEVPRLEIPDAGLQHLYQLGVYKQAGLTTPEGIAAGLQGAWMEEHAIPPWSNDFHFNINVQLIYGPALPTNRAGHLTPLWNLIREWLPTLRANGENFFERPGALMLPHAVDDRCQVIGSFWTGTIDHACTAWMAQMAWQHYRYTLDESLLREIAWPLLVGAFEGYWAMFERVENADGTWRYSIPVSVSPEYGGSSLGACGRDASFQLAACHCITAILPQAAALLGESMDERWAEVTRHLPPYTAVADGQRIGLWENQDLAESHRHHSHLAAIWPFATVDPHSDDHWQIIGKSLERWGTMGAGRWTGWCLPWASILCSRCGLPDGAVAWLHWLRNGFTNVGHGTLHDPDIAGIGGSWGEGSLKVQGFRLPDTHPEIMQMDAAMAAISAILELLVQSRGDTIHVLERLPKRWRDFSFEGVRTEGAFLVSAEVKRGQVRQISVKAEKGGRLRLRHSLGANAKVHRGDHVEAVADSLFEVSLVSGEEVRLVAS